MKGYQAHALQIHHCNVMYSVDGNDETTRCCLFTGYSGCHDNGKTKYNTIIIGKENMDIFTTTNCLPYLQTLIPNNVLLVYELLY